MFWIFSNLAHLGRFRDNWFNVKKKVKITTKRFEICFWFPNYFFIHNFSIYIIIVIIPFMFSWGLTWTSFERRLSFCQDLLEDSEFVNFNFCLSTLMEFFSFFKGSFFLDPPLFSSVKSDENFHFIKIEKKTKNFYFSQNLHWKVIM